MQWQPSAKVALSSINKTQSVTHLICLLKQGDETAAVGRKRVLLSEEGVRFTKASKVRDGLRFNKAFNNALCVSSRVEMLRCVCAFARGADGRPEPLIARASKHTLKSRSLPSFIFKQCYEAQEKGALAAVGAGEGVYN